MTELKINKIFIVICYIFLILANKSLHSSEYTNDTYLAYVKTQNANINQISKNGLISLKEILSKRTAITPKGVVEININEDNIYYFPFIYWPLTQDNENLATTTKIKIKSYLSAGGMILFDVIKNKRSEINITQEELNRIKKYLAKLGIKSLIPLPKNHTLSRSFYLLKKFSGRWDTNIIFVEKSDLEYKDGVNSVILGFNNWASAWALDKNGYPFFPVVPGGEKQREISYRFGVNLSMYALTGNYKSDQVHSKSILKRLK